METLLTSSSLLSDDEISSKIFDTSSFDVAKPIWAAFSLAADFFLPNWLAIPKYYTEVLQYILTRANMAIVALQNSLD
jgi:hypothetical protein